MERFKSDYEMIEVDEASDRVHQVINDFRELRNYKNYDLIKLSDALNRILFIDVLSDVNIPSLPTSIMDGYAINIEESLKYFKLTSSFEYDIREKIYADGLKICLSLDGRYNDDDELRPFAAYVTTGSPIPSNYDCVIPVEKIGKKSNIITILEDFDLVVEGQFIRPIGANIKQGDLILSKNTKLNSISIALLASLGLYEVKVKPEIKIGIMSNGDELMDPLNKFSLKINEGRIYDSNKTSMIMLLKEHFNNNVKIIDLGINNDNLDTIQHTFSLAKEKECDIIISTGGVSMGEKDYLKEIFKSFDNSKLIFGRVNMKPGLPTTFGIINDSLVFCLSGNPVSCIVGYYLFVKPSINSLLYNTKENINKELEVQIYHDIKVTSERPEYIRGKLFLNINTNKLFCVSTANNQLSSTLMSLKDSNCFILLPKKSNNPFISKNSTVKVLLVEQIYLINKDEEVTIINNLNMNNKDTSNTIKCGCDYKTETQITIKIGILVISDKLINSEYTSNLSYINFSNYFKNKSKYSIIDLPCISNNNNDITNFINDVCLNNKVDILFTSGGTGISIKDCTSDAVKKLLDKETTGISQLITQENIKINKICALSRTISGIKNKTFIVTFPGNPKAVNEILDIIEPLFSHIYNQINKLKDFH